ncbi:MAG: Hydrolase [Myxococcales bacterium]|nr:Hydrolase [Myxococcales bacterium]
MSAATSPASPSHKSTNVRVRSRAAGWTAGWTVGSYVAAPWVERAALARFVTAPHTSPAAPEVSGVKTHQFWIDGPVGRLCAYDWGDSGPTVLLAHGWGGTAAQMSGFVRPLLDAGFHVLAYDQPAHGSSAGRRATVRDFAAATAAVAAKAYRVHGVIGHSLGATAALLALGHGLTADRLALLAPAVELSFFVRGFAASLGLTPRRIDGVLARAEAEIGPFDSFDVRTRAPSFSSAGLIIHDPRDREAPYAQAAALALAWPDAQLRTVEKLGHRRLLADLHVIRDAVDFMQPGRVEGLSKTA